MVIGGSFLKNSQTQTIELVSLIKYHVWVA